MEKLNREYTIGVIIPCYNEGSFLAKLLSRLRENEFKEVVIVDGGSTDRTKSVAQEFGCKVIESPKKGRAVQMNFAAKQLNTDWLLFLHADVDLSSNFHIRLKEFLNDRSLDLGNFRLKFEPGHWFLNLNALFSYSTAIPFQFGDQGLIIRNELFKEYNGFDETLLYMEGNEIIRRLKKKYLFKKLPLKVFVSSRKYKEYGAFKLQLSYYAIYLLTRLGLSQQKVKSLFKRVLA